MSEIPTNMKQVQACITIQSLFRGWVARRPRGPRAIIGTKRKRHKPNNYEPIAEIKQDEYVSGNISDHDTDNVSDHDTDSDYVQGSSEDSSSSDSEDSESDESDVDL